MEHSAGVYKIVNKINDKYYYGSAIDFYTRWRKHRNKLNSNTHDNIHLQAAWNKYGADDFEFIIILICAPEHCIYYEQLFLDKYFDNGILCYNMCSIAGNTLGKKHSQQTIEKNKQSHLGKKATEEAKTNMSNAKAGEKNAMYGKTHSIEVREKISRARRGKKASIETKEKMRKSKTGQKQSLETITKRIIKTTGKKRSLEMREKMSKAAIGRIPWNKGIK